MPVNSKKMEGFESQRNGREPNPNEGMESRRDAGEPEIIKEGIESGRNAREPESKQRD